MGTWAPLTKYNETGHRSPHHQSHTGHRSRPRSPDVLNKRALLAGVGSGLSPALAPLLPPPGPGTRSLLSLVVAWLASWPCFSLGCSLPSPAPRASLHTCWCVCCSSHAAGSRERGVTTSALTHPRKNWQCPWASVSQPCTLRAPAPSVCPGTLIFLMEK